MGSVVLDGWYGARGPARQFHGRGKHESACQTPWFTMATEVPLSCRCKKTSSNFTTFG